ncbi:MAG: redoxin domain-containing protein [Pseudomonadota bacterium]
MRSVSIPLVLAVALVLITVGAALFRSRRRELGWMATLSGFALAGGLVYAFITGRFGPERPWYQAPSFYVAAAISLAGVWLWLRRPVPNRLRFGLPLAFITVCGGAVMLMRIIGGSAPIAMSMPTMSQPAPTLTYYDADGKLHALSQLRGKVVLLNFWATWCTPCRREMPMLSKLQNAHADDGFVVLYVSLEEPPVLADFLRINRFDGIQGRLADAAPFYNAGKFYPLSYLIGRDGRVEKRWSGRPSEAWIDSAIRAELKSDG